MNGSTPKVANIWHPVNRVPSVQRRILRFIGSLADFTQQLSIGKDYFIDDRVERLQRDWEGILAALAERQ